jgi:hypothetical protein
VPTLPGSASGLIGHLLAGVNAEKNSVLSSLPSKL